MIGIRITSFIKDIDWIIFVVTVFFVGTELFNFKYDVFSDRVADFFELLQPKTDHINLTYIKNIMYFLEMQENYPSLRTRYIDKQTISIALNEIKAHIVDHFNNTFYFSDKKKYTYCKIY